VRPDLVSPRRRNQAKAEDAIAIKETLDPLPSEQLRIVATQEATGLAGAFSGIDEIDIRLGYRLQASLRLAAEIACHLAFQTGDRL